MAGGLDKLDEYHNGGIDYWAIFGNPDNDLCGFKTYGGMEAWLTIGVAYCRDELRKPSINDEWGYQQGVGDVARSTAFAGQLANNGRAGIAGNVFWNAGYLDGPTSYDVNDLPTDRLTFREVVEHAPRA